MYKSKYFIILILLVVLTLNCTVMIPVLNRNTETTELMDYDNLKNIEPNTEIIITFKNDITLKGIFSGLHTYSNEQYYEAYEKMRKDNLELNLPTISENILITEKSGSINSFIFYGFDFNSIVVSDETNKEIYFNISDIDYIKYDVNQIISETELYDCLIVHSVPLKSYLKLITNKEIQTYSLLNIVKIEKFQQKPKCKNSFLIGLLIDVALFSIFGILYTINHGNFADSW